MENLDYKLDIVQSRTGNLGSSDSKMIQQIAEMGSVPQSAIKRLAVLKGLCENPTFTNRAMQFGDFAENMIFENLKASDSRWQSNPCIISKKYSRHNVGVLTHIDFMLQDDENKVLTICECKATKSRTDIARYEYRWQLAHHWKLGKELARNLGGYKLKMMFAHYHTKGLDLEQPFEFDANRLTVKPVRDMERFADSYQLEKGIDIISAFLEDFNEFYDGDSVDSKYLPVNVKEQFDQVTALLKSIDEQKSKVDEFKAKLYSFMLEKEIKSIKSEQWSITRVDSTTTTTLDTKKFAEDYMNKHPKLAKKISAQFSKTTTKKGYVVVKIKDNK